jgi:hypothetical protein
MLTVPEIPQRQRLMPSNGAEDLYTAWDAAGLCRCFPEGAVVPCSRARHWLLAGLAAGWWSCQEIEVEVGRGTAPGTAGAIEETRTTSVIAMQAAIPGCWQPGSGA